MSLTRLSANTLNIFCDCPHCFWLHMNQKFKRPRGIFPSLPGGMDILYKDVCDRDRADPYNKIMGPILKQIGEEVVLWGSLEDIKPWRHWMKAPRAQFPDYGVELSVALDDIVEVGPDNEVAPFDWKTSSHEPREINLKKYKCSPSNTRIPEYAGRQQDLYGLALKEAGFNLHNWGYVAWTWPIEALETKDDGVIGVPFEVVILPHELDLFAAEELLKRAGECLAGKLPGANSDCEYCVYALGYAGAVSK